MAGLVPAIHVFTACEPAKTWMPGTRPGMTVDVGSLIRKTSVAGDGRRPEGYPIVNAIRFKFRKAIEKSVWSLAYRPLPRAGVEKNLPRGDVMICKWCAHKLGLAATRGYCSTSCKKQARAAARD